MNGSRKKLTEVFHNTITSDLDRLATAWFDLDDTLGQHAITDQ